MTPTPGTPTKSGSRRARVMDFIRSIDIRGQQSSQPRFQQRQGSPPADSAIAPAESTGQELQRGTSENAMSNPRPYDTTQEMNEEHTSSWVHVTSRVTIESKEPSRSVGVNERVSVTRSPFQRALEGSSSEEEEESVSNKAREVVFPQDRFSGKNVYPEMMIQTKQPRLKEDPDEATCPPVVIEERHPRLKEDIPEAVFLPKVPQERQPRLKEYVAETIYPVSVIEERQPRLKKDTTTAVFPSMATEERQPRLKEDMARVDYHERVIDDKLPGKRDEQEKEDGSQSIKKYQKLEFYHRICDVLEGQGRVAEAVAYFRQIKNELAEDTNFHDEQVRWELDFRHHCGARLEKLGDVEMKSGNYDDAVEYFLTALSHNDEGALQLAASSLTPDTLLIKWASAVLLRGSVNDALATATKFKHPKFVIYRAICDALEGKCRIIEAIGCSRRMKSELAEDKCFRDERKQWEFDFQHRCRQSAEKLGDVAMDSENYIEAAKRFSTVLSLSPPNRVDILIKRSKARASTKLWEQALSDANEVIDISPLSHRGYEILHAAMHGAGRHAEAVEAFDMMLSRLNASRDAAIRSGRLYDKQKQAEAFEALPIYNELMSSMTIKLDEARIWKAVKEFYRYVMLSHRWENSEPLLQEVDNISIYDLEPSLANVMLQKFCRLVDSLGFRWAWGDTCCIDKTNNVVLQESLVAIFTWYRDSSLTIVYLRGVPSEPRAPGGLQGSVWNTRAWTYQEYVAAETILFYTEDWEPYLGLTLPNHKTSPEVIFEMQQATGVSAKEMAVLRPGLDRVREKLYLASRRKTTLIEDAAYSLFGIFNLALPVIYGERDQAVGRLLEHILTGSGDVTVLAWTGTSGVYNSCLPKNLTVYDPLVPPHIPLPIEKAEMDGIVEKLRSSSPEAIVMKLHKRLNKLPSPSMAARRLKLPGITCTITELILTSESYSGTCDRWYIYRAVTSMFGDIEIKTAENLTRMQNLCLVHPWIRPLLDQELPHGAVVPKKTTQTLRLIARLRQPFGALLFVPLSRVEFKRVAADSLIMARISKEVSLGDLIDGICTIEVQ